MICQELARLGIPRMTLNGHLVLKNGTVSLPEHANPQ